MNDREWVEQFIDKNEDKYIRANDEIWGFAELALFYRYLEPGQRKAGDGNPGRV